ncbi:MAG: transposase [Prochloraceae cyanobacterium]|nr:transposase [Prochloraceae cyanobacterium]
MKLVERHIIKKGHQFFDECDSLCFASKNLYNLANYNIRQGFIYTKTYSNYNLLARALKQTKEYKALPAKVAQQVLIVLERNWSTFFAALAEWKKSPEKFTGRPKLPKYKDKQKGRNILVYTKQAISKLWLKKGVIAPSKAHIKIPTKIAPESIKEVRIVPNTDCYIVEVIYEQINSISQSENDKNIASIDLGLNNLIALTSNQPGFQPILINGRPLKSINQFYNKKKASLQEKLPRFNYNSKRILRLTRRRNQKINNYLHHASNQIVNILRNHSIGTLVIGQNKQQKQSINIGKTNNQNFVNISHSKLIAQLTYKCDKVGIKVILTEESYTSASSFLDSDPIPVYGDDEAKLIKFSGKRVKRGLYRSSSGKSINADVNAAYNILRKVFPKAFADGIESCVVQPRLVTPTKEKMKGEAEMPFMAM